jgi:transcriptional regulator with XRE-family HTH domain
MSQLLHERLSNLLAPYTNNQAAQQLDVHPSVVSRIRAGKRSPTLEHIRKLCAWLKVSADYLLGLTVEAEGWRIDSADEPIIRVPRFSEISILTAAEPPEERIKAWVPFLERDLVELIGHEPDDPSRIVLIPAVDHSGYLLVDRGYSRADIRSGEQFVVLYRGQLSVRRIDLHESLLICTGKDQSPLPLSIGKSDPPERYLLARLLSEHLWHSAPAPG